MFCFPLTAENVMPERYRDVALSSGLDSLEPEWLEAHFRGREAYFRTRFIVATKGDDCALVEVSRPADDNLFSSIGEVRMLATRDECLYVVRPEVDVGVASQLAAVAAEFPAMRCVVVEGRYAHVSFIYNPKPLRLRVLDIVPPFPSKLLDQVRRVLDVSEDLPPILIEPQLVDSREELSRSCNPLPATVIVPCRGSGIAFEGVEVRYLDERPPLTDWTLLGCERSHQIHKWFFGSLPPTVDICPKRFLPDTTEGDGQVLTRCCLLQTGMEEAKGATFVPWGATLTEVRDALDVIIKKAGVPWTRI